MSKARIRLRLPLAAVVAGGAALALSLTSCAPPGGAADTGDVDPTAVSTDASAITGELVLYDGAGLKTVDDALIAAFEEQYPDVTVTGRYDPDDVQAQNAPRVLASDDPPDIARIIALSDVVGNGQLTKLDAYADSYGWTDLPAGQLSQYEVDGDGVRGSGSQYTVASGFTVTGLYYNKTLMEQLGISTPPATLDELNEALATAKAGGVLPMIVGNQDGGATLAVQMMINNFAGADAVNGWIYHEADATIDTPDAVSGVQQVQDWVTAGYFNDDANGTDGTTAVGRFGRGEGLFYPSGNWNASTINTALGDDAGFILPPSTGSGASAMSDPLSNFGIPAKADNKDAAAAFLNFLLSPEARQIVVDNGFAPSGVGDAPTTDNALSGEVQSAFSTLVEDNGQVQFVQNATNGINATWTSEVQSMFAGQATPQEVLTAVQKQYTDELAG